MNGHVKVQVGNAIGIGIDVREAHMNAASTALDLLSDKDKVTVALKAILDTTDTGAAGTLSFAANRITEHAHILMREAFERECG